MATTYDPLVRTGDQPLGLHNNIRKLAQTARALGQTVRPLSQTVRLLGQTVSDPLVF